jgi:hypothetical protein
METFGQSLNWGLCTVIKISAQQMQLLDAHGEANFAATLAEELVKYFPYRFGQNGVAVPFDHALACIHQGKSLGLRARGAITRYANLCTLMGVGFECTEFAINNGLAPRDGELLDPIWLDRIVPAVEQLLRNR